MKQLYGSAIIVSGPSGVGKSTLCGKALQALPEIKFSISCTTRNPRGSEQTGVEYFFLSHQEFEKRIANDEFVEHAEVFGNYYGTLKSQLLDPVKNGYDVFLDIDIQGAMQIREACKKDQLLANVCEFIFIVPPSLQILEARLRGRATDSEEQLALRIGKAKHELSFANLYDYIIVNDNLELAAEEMLSLISSFKLSTKRRQWEE